MVFNSIQFALFLPVVFALYWFAFHKKLSRQNSVLLIASYFFYACWDWRFLFLLIFSTLLDFYTAKKIHESTSSKSRKTWLWLSITISLSFLGLFKYYNFFADSFQQLFAIAGIPAHPVMLHIILPAGISFYTFHGLSYLIDVYKKRIAAERKFLEYAVFVCFFPLLVAGPIERATHLLPQIKKQRIFNYLQATDGLKQILWGLFKKVVIADRCAVFVNVFFDHPTEYNGSTLLLGAILFAFQIYGDFSGYSDIAIGTAKLFGIELLRNFAYPYFSRDIAEFWRRWHMSLTTWFRDYLYIPLGGSKGNTWNRIRNTFIIFIVSGFWHGANFTFIVWGLLNAFYFLPYLLTNTNRNHLNTPAGNKIFPGTRELASITTTFMLTVFAWIFFRADNLPIAIQYLSGIFSTSLFTVPKFQGLTQVTITCILIVLFQAIEWIGRHRPYALQVANRVNTPAIRYGIYYICIAVIAICWLMGKEQQFIYFQF